MNGQIVARTKEQESVCDDNVFWWKEFRVRKITTDEYYKLNLDAPYQEWILEDRILCRIPDGRIIAKFPQGELAKAILNPMNPDDAWRVWQLGKSPKTVIWEMLGDSSFFEAVSLTEIHADLVQKSQLLRDAYKAERNAEHRRNAAYESLDDFKRNEERKFYKKHGHKTGTDFDKARERTIKRLTPELNRLREEAKQADLAWEMAKQNLSRMKAEFTF